MKVTIEEVRNGWIVDWEEGKFFYEDRTEAIRLVAALIMLNHGPDSDQGWSRWESSHAFLAMTEEEDHAVDGVVRFFKQEGLI